MYLNDINKAKFWEWQLHLVAWGATRVSFELIMVVIVINHSNILASCGKQ